MPGNYTCACPPDYEGHSCEEVKIKTCDHSPCLNGGSCRPGRNAYTDDLYICDCLTLYRGIDCEVKKDFCEENEQPCRNGATCVSVDSLLVRYSKPGFAPKCSHVTFSSSSAPSELQVSLPAWIHRGLVRRGNRRVCL